MKRFLRLLPLFLCVTFMSCSGSKDSNPDIEKSSEEDVTEEKQKTESSADQIAFEINMDELYGDWVMIGVGADRMGPGVAPVGEIMFAFRDNGNMTVATEGREEIEENLAGIPSPYTIDDKKLCSDDIVFKLQFKQPCAEIIRLNEGRMSIEIEIPNGGYMYKHFVKLEE